MPLILGIKIAAVAFFAEYVDSALGMGYGTIMTPVLILMGFNPIVIVPSVLLSEFITGLLAGFTHHRAGNVNFKHESTNLISMIKYAKEFGYITSLKKNLPLHLKIALLLAFCSIAGTVSAVFIAVSIPKYWLTLYIGILISIIGLVILLTLNKKYKFSWRKIVALGLLASFNKGISGGGYGPVVVGGQLLSGVDTKPIIGITSLAEALTCFVGVIMYLIISPNLNWMIAPFIITGAVMAVPLAAKSVKVMEEDRLRKIIGVTTLILGILTIFKIVKAG